MKRNHPSQLELQVLSVLWEIGPSTVRDVLHAIPDGKDRAYTTVLSVLQKMEKKSLVKRKPAGKAHIYSAAKTQKQILEPLVSDMVNNIYGGKPAVLIKDVLGVSKLSADEKEVVTGLLAQHKANMRKRSATKTSAKKATRKRAKKKVAAGRR